MFVCVRGPIRFGLRFHFVQTCIVVGEFFKMSPGNLPGLSDVVARHIGLRVSGAVLELNLKTATKLFKVDLVPIYSESGADAAGLGSADLTLIDHIRNSF